VDEGFPMEPLVNKPVTRIASHCLSVVDCCRSENMVYTFATLLAFAPPDYNLSHARSKREQNEAREIRDRGREPGRPVRLTPLNEQEYGR
jgi:hypothetical protein